MNNCWCYNCNKDRKDESGFFPYSLTRMILCPTCGNKRCPKASDHRLTCTNSNNPGQLGSTYGIYPHPALPVIDFLESKND